MDEEKDLTKLLHEHYDGETHKLFEISHGKDGEEKQKVQLIDIKELGEGQEGHRAAFSLIFESKGKKAKLEQGVYKVDHRNLGTGRMFLVPVHPGEMDGKDKDEIYEAVFA